MRFARRRNPGGRSNGAGKAVETWGRAEGDIGDEVDLAAICDVPTRALTPPAHKADALSWQVELEPLIHRADHAPIRKPDGLSRRRRRRPVILALALVVLAGATLLAILSLTASASSRKAIDYYAVKGGADVGGADTRQPSATSAPGEAPAGLLPANYAATPAPPTDTATPVPSTATATPELPPPTGTPFILRAYPQIDQAGNIVEVQQWSDGTYASRQYGTPVPTPPSRALASLARPTPVVYSYIELAVDAPGTYRYPINLNAGGGVEGYFQDAKGDTITFWIEDPSGNVVYSPGKVFGTWNFRISAGVAGVYSLLFRNTDISVARTIGLWWRPAQ